jgi:hypothetical protein
MATLNATLEEPMSDEQLAAVLGKFRKADEAWVAATQRLDAEGTRLKTELARAQDCRNAALRAWCEAKKATKS